MGQEAIIDRALNATPQLVETLYRTVSEPDAWLSFMCQMVRILDGRSARMLVMDGSATRVTSSLKLNIDDNYHQQYVDHYVNACPWRPELKQFASGRLYSSYLDFSCKQQQFFATEFYNDWARPQGIHHGICGTVLEDDQTTVQFLVQRTKEPGHFTRAETDFVNTLVPHMQRAIQLGRRFGSVRQEANAIAQAASRSVTPFILIDRSRKIAYESPGADRLLTIEHGIAVRGGQFLLTDGDAQRLLEKLVGKCIRSASGNWQSAGGQVAALTPQGTRLRITVTPVLPQSEGGLSFVANSAYAALFLHSEPLAVRLDEAHLRNVFRFTPAEIRLANALANGEALQEMAERHGCSIHTLRSQLKSLFAKTGKRSQPELVSLLLTGMLER